MARVVRIQDTAVREQCAFMYKCKRKNWRAFPWGKEISQDPFRIISPRGSRSKDNRRCSLKSVNRERKNMPFSIFQQQMDIARTYPRAIVYKRASTRYKISRRRVKYKGGRSWNRIFAYKSKFLCLTGNYENRFAVKNKKLATFSANDSKRAGERYHFRRRRG